MTPGQISELTLEEIRALVVKVESRGSYDMYTFVGNLGALCGPYHRLGFKRNQVCGGVSDWTLGSMARREAHGLPRTDAQRALRDRLNHLEVSKL